MPRSTPALPPLEGPIRPVWGYVRGFWSLIRNTGNHTLLALTSTGLYFRAAAELLGDVAPQIATRVGFGLPWRAREIAGEHSLLEDKAGRTVLALRRTGLDGRWSDETVADLRTRMQVGDPVAVDPLAGVDQGTITATLILTQSLMFMNGDPITAPLYPGVEDHANLHLEIQAESIFAKRNFTSLGEYTDRDQRRHFWDDLDAPFAASLVGKIIKRWLKA